MSKLMLKSLILVSLAILLIGPLPTDSINLQLNRGVSRAYGNKGSLSHSEAETYGVDVSLRRAGGTNFEPLYQQSGGRSNSYSTGEGAPRTWVNGHTQTGNGVRGGINAGFQGGNGFTSTDSRSRQYDVKLQNGATLRQNLLSREERLKNLSN